MSSLNLRHSPETRTNFLAETGEQNDLSICFPQQLSASNQLSPIICTTVVTLGSRRLLYDARLQPKMSKQYRCELSVMGCLHDPANVQQTSSKLPANVFKIHVLMLDVCWKFAGSCRHPISLSLKTALFEFTFNYGFL